MVSVLFARRDSVYKTLGVDVWDENRNALKWPGGNPVVAHPPCRAWASLKHCAKVQDLEYEKGLALWAVDMIRKYGGVLEHPVRSDLWREKPLPEPGDFDEYGGFSLIVDQNWWGHRARKRTKLYICGIGIKDVPPMPLKLGDATHTVGLWSGRDRATCRPTIARHEFEATPIDFARWLVSLAEKCQ